MSVNNAYQLMLGVFRQRATGGSGNTAGAVWSILPDPYSKLKWDKSESIIPVGYDFTNYQIGDATVETVEKNTITALTKARMYDSGAMTPPTLTFATMLPADVSTLLATLDAITASEADDQYKVLITAGVFKEDNATGSGAATTRTYDVFNAVVGVLTTDGGRQGEAKAPLTGTLAFQACHLPIVGKTACNATLTYTISTGEVSLTTT